MSRLFSPVKIRGETIRNRLFVAPMCQYSSEAQDGIATQWHMVHLGSRAVGGAGLVMTEAAAITPQGRISPHDLGIWSDGHAEALIPIVEFILSQDSVPAIQIAHAGRKASHDRPWDGSGTLTLNNGGWEIIGPSPIAYEDNWIRPLELSVEDIKRVELDFVEAAKRSVDAGFKAIELHFAHGYLVCEFMSPLSNQRSDFYGGSLRNRCRLGLDIVDAIRKVIPDSMPLLVRISSTEYMKDGWAIEDSIAFTKMLMERGVDMIDCSSGGNSAEQEMDPYPGYQVPFSARMRHDTGAMTGAVGLITEPYQAEQILRNEEADVILLGRELLRDPYWPLHAQVQLDQDDSVWPRQYVRARV